MRRVLLLIPCTSYRARDFLDAAHRLGIEVVVGSNHGHVLETHAESRTLTVDFEPVGEGISQILAHARKHPLSAIVGTDDATSLLAAAASKALRLPHNEPQAVATARDKYRFRQAMAAGGIRSPWFTLVSLRNDPAGAARSASYPCVLKPLALSASRGVIRVDGEAAFVAATRRIANILDHSSEAAGAHHRDAILCEAYIPGWETALEGMLEAGRLRMLALFDKPDPLDGPFFEETLYVTPSRLSHPLQHEILAEVERAALTVGLCEGPIHAEVRVNEQGVWLIELAPRSIGGLCSRALSFAPDLSLEELILRHALGMPTGNYGREDAAAGVMMIPIPRPGRLRAVAGLAAARAVPGVDEVTITVPIGDILVPVPEGDRYLGFIFARARYPVDVEVLLRQAHEQLWFDIEQHAE